MSPITTVFRGPAVNGVNSTVIGDYHRGEKTGQPPMVPPFTEIRNSVSQGQERSVNGEVHDREQKLLDSLRKPSWFRHAAAGLPEEYNHDSESGCARQRRPGYTRI